jgi:DNA-binding HxlR family transcriptional regulator
MQTVHNLTDPQLKLLLDLRARPRALSTNFRPLKPLVEQELVRPRHVGCYGSNATYELTAKGQQLTQAVLEERAAAEP